MTHVRLHGDPFGDGAVSSALRSFLWRAQGSGLRVHLSLAAVPPRAPEPGERSVALDDGLRRWTTSTRLPEEAVERLLAAARVDVAATAPVLTFATSALLEDAARLAGLAWPQACAVVPARCDLTSEELLARLKAELRWASTDASLLGVPELQLRPWLALERSTSTCCVHVADDVFACGTDLVIETFAAHFAGRGRRLRLVLPNTPKETVTDLLALAGAAASEIDVDRGAFSPEHVRDAAAIVQPYRRLTDPAHLVSALASGCPVVAARFAATAPLLASEAVAFSVGGRHAREGRIGCAYFAPDPRALRAAWAAALAEASPSRVGRRARTHVVDALQTDRPAAPPPPVHRARPGRPLVALEGPVFESSIDSERILEIGRALLARGNVDLCVVPRGSIRRDLAWLRERAPELESALSRNPGRVDLWLSTGSPSRADRPACRRWAVHVDAGRPAQPLALTPHVATEADVVVVPEERARRAVTSAGRAVTEVHVAPDAVALPDCAEAASSTQAEPGASPWAAAAAVIEAIASSAGAEPTVELPSLLAAEEPQRGVRSAPRPAAVVGS